MLARITGEGIGYPDAGSAKNHTHVEDNLKKTEMYSTSWCSVGRQKQ